MRRAATEALVSRCWDANASTWSTHLSSNYDTFRDAFHQPAYLRFLGPLAGRDVLDAVMKETEVLKEGTEGQRHEGTKG